MDVGCGKGEDVNSPILGCLPRNTLRDTSYGYNLEPSPETTQVLKQFTGCFGSKIHPCDEIYFGIAANALQLINFVSRDVRWEGYTNQSISQFRGLPNHSLNLIRIID
jgi:hypothetical protein